MVHYAKHIFVANLIVIAVLFAILNISVKSPFHSSTGDQVSSIPADTLGVGEIRVLQNDFRTKRKWFKEPEQPKIILFWTKFFSGSNSYLREEGDRIRRQECPVSNCVLSEDRSLWNESSALIFHPLDFNEGDVPSQRSASQYYVFFVLESPEHAPSADLPCFYNLTFTYRFDSDIIADNYLQYFRPKHLKTREQFEEIWRRKTQDRAAIFVSNCGGSSRRLEYVQELAKYYPVDVFGDCGNYTCPRSKRDECDALITTYKFYLSFENSICRDYITEKSVRGYMADTIPVFLGGVNYSSVFPANSFLDVLDYSSPRELARELQRLSNDKDAYFQFMKFRFQRRQNRLPDYLQPENVSLCKLCDLLNTKDRYPSSYPSMTKWWDAKKDCRSPPWNLPPWLFPLNSPVVVQQQQKQLQSVGSAQAPLL